MSKNPHEAREFRLDISVPWEAQFTVFVMRLYFRGDATQFILIVWLGSATIPEGFGEYMLTKDASGRIILRYASQLDMGLHPTLCLV